MAIRRSAVICLIFLIISGCSRVEPIDYDELMPEELEILLRSGKAELAPRVCYGYAHSYLETPYEEWWVLGEGYKAFVRSRFIDSCTDLYRAKKDSTAACYLEDYYRAAINEGEINLPGLIYYSRGCGKSDSLALDISLQNDARILAMVEHIPIAFTYLSKATDKQDLYKRISKVEDLFRHYLSDLEASRENSIIYKNQIPSLVESLKGINTTLTRLKLSLNATDLTVEISSILGLIEDLSVDASLLSSSLKVDINAVGASQVNKSFMFEVEKELAQFRKDKEKFLQEYDGYLK